MSYKSIGKQLQLAREEAGWSQEQMAARIGCSQSALSNYEKGKRRIYLAQLEKIAEILNRPLEYFLQSAELPNDRPVFAQESGVPESSLPEGGTGKTENTAPAETIQGSAEAAMLEVYRSLSVEGKQLARDFIEWVRKREVAGND